MSSILQNGNYIQYGPKIIPGLRDNQSLHLVAEKEFTKATTSTTAESIGTMTVNNVSLEDLYLIDVQDTAGRRTDHFLYMRQLLFIRSATNTPNYATICDAAGALTSGSSANGIYCSASSYSNKRLSLTISAKYNSTYTKTIDGTYRVRVYKLEL